MLKNVQLFLTKLRQELQNTCIMQNLPLFWGANDFKKDPHHPVRIPNLNSL